MKLFDIVKETANIITKLSNAMVDKIGNVESNRVKFDSMSDEELIKEYKKMTGSSDKKIACATVLKERRHLK